MKKTLLLLLLMGFSSLFAQKEISGTVTDNSGKALTGVNVTEKGTTNGTTTDMEGKFKIRAAENATLTFSYVGFPTIEKSTTNLSLIDVTLSEGQELNEIQIVGSRN